MSVAADTRIAYGAICSWWGPIAEVGVKPSGLPCCPVCGGVLMEVPSEEEWWAGVDRYEADGHPLYREFVEWLRTVHYPTLAAAQAAFEGRPDEALTKLVDEIKKLELEAARSDARPGAVEGSRSPDAVVGDQADGDHTAPGRASDETCDAATLMDSLEWLIDRADKRDVDLPVRLEILGAAIDIAGVNFHDGEIRIVGAEVIDP